MKNNTKLCRLTAFLLCLVLLFVAAPLPQSFAAPDDEDSVSDTTDTDTSDTDGDGTSDTTQGNTASNANVIAAAADAPTVTVEAALLVSPDSGMVLYEKMRTSAAIRLRPPKS